MTARLLLLVAALTAGCAAEAEGPRVAPTPKPARAADLDALAAMRAGSGGAALEEKAAQTRSANATQVYAAGADEAALIEIEAASEATGKSVDEIAGIDRRSEFEAPSDLDKAAERLDPWVDKDLVSNSIRKNHRSLQQCWDEFGPGGGGTVKMRITINTRGETSARLSPSSKARSPELARCVASGLERMDMPQAKNGAVTFEYPIRF